MNVTAEELRKYYDSLLDAALLSVDKSELTELGLACYEEECERRSLHRPVPGSRNSPPSSSPESIRPAGATLVRIAEGLSGEEFRYARELLASSGIPSEAGNANPGSAFSNAVGDFYLLVPEELAEQARQILEVPLTDEELAAQAEQAALDEDTTEGAP
jgi:hypothetical protein